MTGTEQDEPEFTDMTAEIDEMLAQPDVRGEVAKAREQMRAADQAAAARKPRKGSGTSDR